MIRRTATSLMMVAALLGLAGCGGKFVPTSFSLSGPSQISKPGLPFMTYTVVTRQGADPEFVYFMIIKPPQPAGGTQRQSSSSQGSAVGLKGQASSKFSINGKDLTVEYKLTVRPDGSLDSESFVIGGKNQPLDKGRVFLVDLSQEPISVVAHAVKLPIAVQDFRNPSASEGLAESTLKELEEDPAIAEFVRPLR